MTRRRAVRPSDHPTIPLFFFQFCSFFSFKLFRAAIYVLTMATTTTPAMAQQEVSPLPTDKIRTMIDACGSANLPVIQQLVAENSLYVCQQDFETGLSPLMAAAKSGHLELCQQLLDQGAPWNAVDRQGQCPGNHATDAEHWAVVNLLVEWGTRSELILGEIQRSQRKLQQQQGQTGAVVDSDPNGTIIAEHQPCTKPDYLQHRLRYNQDGTALLDEDDDAVMMEWERPIMRAHAQIMMEAPGKRVLNVGFGMGIIDTILQEYNPNLHIIIEAHPDVYKRMLEQKWDKKPNVKICHGKWQDVMPELIKSGVELDAVFYDTYAEHAFDMEDFHVQMSQILSKPQGVYSFFNGLAPDNMFFHGVGTFWEDDDE
jgi:protein arginine N-methyltransferase 2